MKRLFILLFLTGLFGSLMTGCRSAAAKTAPDAVITRPAAVNTATTAPPVPTIAPAVTATAAPSVTPLPAPRIWLSPLLPKAVADSMRLPEGWDFAENELDATLRLDIQDTRTTGAEPSSIANWVYALAVPFPTVIDEISLSDLQALWRGSPPDDLPIRVLLVDALTAGIFDHLWGSPGPTVYLRAARQLIDEAWNTPGAAAILPFEQLEPRWKVLLVDGQSPVRKDFKQDQYGLSVRFALSGVSEGLEAAQIPRPLLASNRDPDQLTTVVLTGVTALVRGTGSYMERYGNTYPAQDIGPWLREADILHINNEVPFAKNCPPPHNWEGLVFCSRPKYIELLEDVGADVIELAGDHFQDWGPDAMRYTLELYKERGWKYYGGGENLEDARQPAHFEHNGNRLAFIGCNAKPPGYATASATNPGAAHCDFTRLEADVRKLREEGYLPIVTFQHLEYYSYDPHPILQADFARVAEAGAVIVSGSQAHQPHAMAFQEGAFLHYGLGNLFFDQTNQGDAPRTAFIDRHIFYGGRHISTELLTIYLVDYARSRPMTPEERAALLQVVFSASGWEP